MTKSHPLIASHAQMSLLWKKRNNSAILLVELLHYFSEMSQNPRYVGAGVLKRSVSLLLRLMTVNSSALYRKLSLSREQGAPYWAVCCVHTYMLQ